MSLFSGADRIFAETIAELAHSNPFLPTRIELERRALGAEFNPQLADWNVRPQVDGDHGNLSLLLARSQSLLETARDRLAKSGRTAEPQLPLYEDLLLMVLYHRYRAGLDELTGAPPAKGGPPSASKIFGSFRQDAERLLCFGDRRLPMADQLGHIFAGFFQIRRAFENIFRFILGVSQPAIRLRAAVWESVFTHDMRRYRAMFFARMADFTTLIVGPSGTGKELVAQAVGLSRYVPFSEATGRFSENFAGSFYPVNLAALSPTLIESELFGHKRGSFTGAVADRQGWLEVCPELGTVFLDEIGEVESSIQVKLLRVLQSRTFSRLGETSLQRFRGKLIAATNRDLAEAIREGEFREDFYYRLCSDVIVVPSLRERIADNPAELRELVTHLVTRVCGSACDELAQDVLRWIEENLGNDYSWPGNVRELEQCVRNVIVRRSYARPNFSQAGSAQDHEALLAGICEGALTADELLRRYCTIVFGQTGSYEATARRLQLDRRTVKSKVDSVLLEKLRPPRANESASAQ